MILNWMWYLDHKIMLRFLERNSSVFESTFSLKKMKFEKILSKSSKAGKLKRCPERTFTDPDFYQFWQKMVIYWFRHISPQHLWHFWPTCCQMSRQPFRWEFFKIKKEPKKQTIFWQKSPFWSVFDDEEFRSQ